MRKYKSLIPVLYFCIFLAALIQAQTKADLDIGKTSAPTIKITEPNISDKTIKLHYEIKNDSEQDIWICEDISVNLHDPDFEAYMAEDKQTLLIRRLLDIDPLGSVVAPPDGRYVRLRAGQSRNETLLLSLPVESRFFWTFPTTEGKAYAKSLALEIGYYPGDLPGIIRDVLIEAERYSDKKLSETNILIEYEEFYENYKKRLAMLECYFKGFLIENRFGGLLGFNESQHIVKHRGEEITIPWTGEFRMGEQVLRTTIDGLQIPYEEKYDLPKISHPDFNTCTKLEILYQPSVLDYFFPYPNERDLLSAEEIRYLQSLQKIVVDNQEHIKEFADEVRKGLPGGIFTKRSTACVICYRDDERLTSFTIYDDRSIVTEEEQCLRYKTGLPSLKKLTPQIQTFQLRLDCANNLKFLWRWLRLYHIAQKEQPINSSLRYRWNRFLFYQKGEKSYPAPRKWCDAMVWAYRTAKGSPYSAYMIRFFGCPNVVQGKCHYAMNPNCEPDSPPDTVLLFETKASWNQHGGLELFTFDNHEPRGGCVLLNDGTVKFIRTQEELQQLRWK